MAAAHRFIVNFGRFKDFTKKKKRQESRHSPKIQESYFRTDTK